VFGNVPVVEIVGSLVRLGALRLSVLLAVAALSGCGSDERALKLPAVKDAVQAAGLKDLRILTQEGGWRDVRAKHLPIVGPPHSDGPDYIQSMVEPAFLVVRFGKLAQARHAARVYSTARFERPTGYARVCNVMVMNFAPASRAERSHAARIAQEIRKRCT
jgi:hypothetical protein